MRGRLGRRAPLAPDVVVAGLDAVEAREALERGVHQRGPPGTRFQSALHPASIPPAGAAPSLWRTSPGAGVYAAGASARLARRKRPEPSPSVQSTATSPGAAAA